MSTTPQPYETPQQKLARAFRLAVEALESGALAEPAPVQSARPLSMTKRQAAAELQIGITTLDVLTKGKSFRKKVGGQVRFDAAGLLAWWARRKS